MEPVTFLSKSSLQLRWPQPQIRVLNPSLGNVEGTVAELPSYHPPQIFGRIYLDGETSDFGPPPVPQSVRGEYSGQGVFRFPQGIPTRGSGRSFLVIWAAYDSDNLSLPRLIDTTSVEIVVY